jgi:hypothetical protein
VPLAAGIVILVLSSLLMLAALQANASLWLVCAAAPFMLGIALTALAWRGRTARWFHLRVRQPAGAWPQNIAISFPLPLGAAAWAWRTFGRKYAHGGPEGIDQVLETIQTSAGPDRPFYLEVDDGEDGEKVQIYIG